MMRFLKSVLIETNGHVAQVQDEAGGRGVREYGVQDVVTGVRDTIDFDALNLACEGKCT